MRIKRDLLIFGIQTHAHLLYQRNRIMKRIILFTGVSLAFILICSVIIIEVSINRGVKERISISQEKYPGNPEEALIAYLSDTTNTTRDRTDIAIWTLGQIQSQKALPILKELYHDDPKGKTCQNRHDSVLCQYGIYKAIRAIESNWWFLSGRHRH